MPEISIIVSTYNWPEALKLCLLSIRKQTVLPREVIIADDGSGSATKLIIEEIKKDFPVPILHVWHEDLGFRKTIILNKAVKLSSGQYIVQIDGDVILEKHFIADHKTLCEPHVFVRGTRAHIEQKRLPEIYRTARIDFSFLTNGIINRFNAMRLPLLSFLFEKKSNNSERVRGSNLAYWKSDFILVNGYNNALTGWGHEDEELAARFVNNNILKKVIKLKAVQFHLSHGQLSRKSEPEHAREVIFTVQLKLKDCINGYAQS
jgi:glycosyltransferase involved in cell wall biosynthesis